MVQSSRNPDKTERKKSDGAELNIHVVAQGADGQNQRGRPDDRCRWEGITGQLALADGEERDDEHEPNVEHHEQVGETMVPALRYGEHDAGCAKSQKAE